MSGNGSDNSKDFNHSIKSNNGDNFQTSNTDMLVHKIANVDKLIATEQRWSYANGNNDDLDEDAGNYMKNNAANVPINLAANNHVSNNETLHNTQPNPSVFQKKHDYNDTSDGTHHTASNAEIPKPVSQEDIMLQKLEYIRKLGELRQAGVILSQNYNMNSDLNMMKYEYELHKSIRAKQNGINWMSSMTLNAIYGIEMLNEKYNPFDLKLRDWSKEMSAEINNYYDIFGELYEKYNQPGKNMAPELKILLMISGSALKFHLMHTLANPSPLNDPMLNPAVAERFRREAVAEKMRENTIKNNNVLNNMMNKEHEQVANKVNDLQKLKEQEIEYLKMQRKQIEMDELKKNLSLNNNLNAQNNLNNTQKSFVPPSNPVNTRANSGIPAAVQKMQQMMADRENIQVANNANNHQNEELMKQQIEFQKRLNEKQLEMINMQQKALKNKLELETIQELEKLRALKVEEEKLKKSHKQQSDTASQVSLKSEISMNNVDEILSKSKQNLESDNQKVMQLDTVDEDDIDDKISFGHKSNKSKKSMNSKVSKVSTRLKKQGIRVNL